MVIWQIYFIPEVYSNLNKNGIHERNVLMKHCIFIPLFVPLAKYYLP